jgi:hypothetical protein
MFVFTRSYQALRFHLATFRNLMLKLLRQKWRESFQTILLQRSVKAMAYCDFSTLFSNSSGVAEHLAASCEHKHVAGFVG